MHAHLRAAVLALGALAACRAPPKPVAPPPAAPAPPPPPPGAKLPGTWESPSCGARAYARRIAFSNGSGFSATDMVAPCGAWERCTWSGIVVRHGTYTVAGDTINLSIAGDAPAKGQPLPTTLKIDASGAPAEGGASPCVYLRI